jgi:hypothetical protein
MMRTVTKCVLVLTLWAAAQAAAQQDFITMETSLPAGAYATFALANDSASFGHDSAENKGLLDKGFGSPVRVQRVFDRHVQVLSPSTKLLLTVPFGWRGFDDGKRTRLFTPTGNIGITLQSLPTDGFVDWDDTRGQVWGLARKTAMARAKKDPRYQARLIRLADGTFGMRETNINEGEEGPYSSVILFRQHPGDPKAAVRMNLYAPIEEFERYLGLAGLVLRDMQPMPGAAAPAAAPTAAPAKK